MHNWEWLWENRELSPKHPVILSFDMREIVSVSRYKVDTHGEILEGKIKESFFS